MLQVQTYLADGTEATRNIFSGEESGQCVSYTIPAQEIQPDTDKLYIRFPFLDAEAGAEGYYVIPHAKVCFLTKFRNRDDFQYISSENIMPMFGAKLGENAFLISVDGMQYDFQLQVEVKNGVYAVALIYDLKQISLYEDIKLTVYQLSGPAADYNGIAKKYQQLQAAHRRLVPIRERMKSNPVLAYGAMDMPVIRVRMAWKPVPTPVLEQTPETEPPMHVACSFHDVELLMDEMKRQGIEKAEICLVGWNAKGHDGRWPQMFPVEEALGGEASLRKLIAHGKQLGYRVTCHTNSSDAYHVADCWNENEIIRTKQGELSVNENAWSGGRMYNLCPKIAYEKYLQRNLPRVKALGFEGFHYIDVLTIVPPRTCFHPEHPLNAGQSVQYLNKILRQTQQEIGGIASEGGFDFAADNLDFSLYVAYNLLSGYPAAADEIIPLWQLVYHGYILSNPSAETVNYCIKGQDNRLRFYEFGGIPAVYYFSKFVGENGMKNWMGEQDMLCDTVQRCTESVQKLKQMLDEYHPYAARQLAYMDRHDKLADGVYQTTYSDGYRVIVNYTEQDYCCDGERIPGKSFRQMPARSDT